MIAWLNPAALAALAAVALPILVHLLLRHRATPVVVPSVRFIASTREAAVRIRRPSDPSLLLVRILIIACAAAALAAPALITDSRKGTWMNRSIRAIVVDTSASVDTRLAGEAAAAESAGAFTVRRFEDADLPSAFSRAAAWLRTAPVGRQEVVLVSDFQHGAVSASAFGRLPDEAGIRTVIVPRRTHLNTDVDGGAVQFGPRTYAQQITLDSQWTSYLLRETPTNAEPRLLKGASTSPVLGKLARTVAATGVFVPADAPLEFASTNALDSLEAAVELHGVLATRRDLSRLSELEPLSIAADVVKSWNRDARPPSGEGWRRPTDSDARWLWLAAIVLLVIEALIRRERTDTSAAVEAHAA
jgi:hypothetical protein